MENISSGSENVAEKNLGNDNTMDAGEPETEKPKDIFIYREDVVCLKSKENTRGLVLDVAGEYDSDGSISDDTDEEDERKSAKGPEHGSGEGGTASNGVYDYVDDHSSLPDNNARVQWTDGHFTIEEIDGLAVLDRIFLHGDIVASASDPAGQLGLVVDVNIMVDLQAASGEVIEGVSSRDLRRIREFTVGDYVVSGPWLGRVDEVLDNVNVLFDDGSVCKVARADPLRLMPALRPMLSDASCPYYPGQRVKAVSSSVFKSCRWINGFWKASRLEGTVTKVETAAVIVYWIASAHFGTNQASVPPEEQNPKDLTLLSCFSHTNWQLNDWCLPYPYVTSFADDTFMENSETKELCSDEHTGKSAACSESSDVPSDIPEFARNVQTEVAQSTKKDASFKLTDGDTRGGAKAQKESCFNTSSVPKDGPQDIATYRKKLRKVFFKREKRTRRRDESFERALLIVNTHTKVDVAWQDGKKECGISSTSLIPVHSPNDHEFFPEQYVVDKVANDVDDSSGIKRVGIVRTVNAKDRTVTVSWLKPVSHPVEPKEFESNEIVSAYELDGHPDYDYCYGDVVVRLPSASHPPELSNSQSTKEQDKNVDSPEATAIPCTKLTDGSLAGQVPQNDSDVIFTSLSWVGNIVGFQDGEIEVLWGDGKISKVGPHEIYVVGREDDGTSLDDGSGSDGASWETVDDNETDLLDDTGKEDSHNPTENNIERENGSVDSCEESSAAASGPLSVAFGFVTRLASEFFARGKKHLDGSTSGAIDEAESQESNGTSEKDENEECDDNDETEGHNNMATSEATAVATNDSLGSSSAVGMSVDVDMVDTTDDSHCFKHFDVVLTPSDHHYVGNTAQGSGGRKWVKKVQQEWSILEKNLPDYIYVRVFEDRMDLIRAVIVGASGTPYQDGLFFFDFHLPPEYPQVPPSVYYHSGGLRVNPNLYVDGKVCLSLLNTWTGKGNEVWDPSSSSILQVLVSLQGLVLNAKPYFNEAGYEKQVGTVPGEKNALPYNENTYLLSLKSMMYLLRRPPMLFEDFVKYHFRNRGYYILKACDAYLQGNLIGTLKDDACTTEKSKEQSSSVGFKLALAKMLPRLISALKEVGASCDQFEHLAKPESLQES